MRLFSLTLVICAAWGTNSAVAQTPSRTNIPKSPDELAVECRLPNIRNYLSGVSPLNVFQHDGQNIKAKGDDNNYQAVATPLTGRHLMNISGTDDRLIPYRGGPSRVIPAKNGKLGFVDAEESIFPWAKAMGYKGEKLSRPS